MGFLFEGWLICFMDIGSGLGGVVLDLLCCWFESEFIGIEIVFLLWLVSWLWVVLVGNCCCFVCGDYLLLDFGDYDVVFVYLLLVVMEVLWYKVCVEMKLGILFLSYEFYIFGIILDVVVELEDGGRVLYGWCM